MKNALTTLGLGLLLLAAGLSVGYIAYHLGDSNGYYRGSTVVMKETKFATKSDIEKVVATCDAWR